ncbi:hypothetical protein PQG02_31775 (plasmid) [Nostoc sp. UHCC 0926]|uniref:hypothetical protein n=1 Tax=Nostoc sp. UHCC 0926 TaxID=3025190 RepID=UPI00235FF6A6|nr:hypothetical protein [Nostoc sp. UHCC 0926]WDD35986.1 hypothetical protein PQG02_31775 [Nostoc sp. UHCC 0926]
MIYPQLWNRRSDRLHWKVCDRTPGGVLRGNEGSDAVPLLYETLRERGSKLRGASRREGGH